MTNKIKAPGILVADDDPEDQAILTEYLLNKKPDLAIHCVLNGKEALASLANTPDDELPALIILDYKMPVLNGLQTLEKLRADSRYKAIPKLIWSTSDREEHKKACLENGAVQYFTKPASPVDLTRMAAHMLEFLANGMAKRS